MSDPEESKNKDQHIEVDSGAAASGKGAKAVGERGVQVGGDAAGPINTGDQKTDTGGGAYVAGNVSAGRDFIGRDKIDYGAGLSGAELAQLFAPLMSAAQEAPRENREEAVETVEALQEEAAKGQEADDSRLAKLLDSLVELAPGAVSAAVSTFATPILGGLAGPVTKFVLDRFKSKQ